MRSMLLLGCVLSLSACTFVHMAPSAAKVKVLSASPSGCVKRGEVEVSVKHKVGFYERSESQVRDELETLARNEASSVPANTVQPLDQPYNGSQRFAALDCPRR